MGTFEDKTGKKFNMLTVEKYLGDSNWLCRCDCGNKKIVKSSLLNEDPKRRQIKSCGCIMRKNIPEKQDYFKNIDTPEKAYILGFIAADGCVQPEANRIKIDLSDIDEDILIKIQKEIGHKNKLSHYVQSGIIIKGKGPYESHTSRLIITSKEMVKDLERYGVVKNKTDVLDLKIELIPKRYFYDFLRGLIDGDGCISYSIEKKYADLSITTSTLTGEKIAKFLEENYFDGNKFYITHRNPDKLTHMTLIATSGSYISDFLDVLYKDSTIYLDGKYQKYLDFKRDTNY